MPRRAFALLFSLFFGLLMACALLEVGVRGLGLAPAAGAPAHFWQDDPRFGWYHIPGAAGDFFDEAGEYHAFAHVNSAGLMDQEYTEAKPADVFRILVLGDSFTEGLRVPMDAAFINLLEQTLRRADGRGVEVLNAGVGGWGTDQQLLFYREIGHRYAPDLVLLAFFPGNDVMNNSLALEAENFGSVYKPFFLLEEGALTLHNFPVGSEELGPSHLPAAAAAEPAAAAAEPAPSPWPGLLARSALYRYLTPRLRVATPALAVKLAAWGLMAPGVETRNAAQGPDYIPLAFGVYRRPPAPVWEEAWTLTAALLQALDAEVTAQGSQLAVILLPAQEQVEAAAWARTLATFPAMQAQAWEVDAPNRRLAPLLDELGIPHLDLLPAFRGWQGRSLFFPIDRHWNEQGHALAAAQIGQWLAEQGLGFIAPPAR